MRQLQTQEINTISGGLYVDIGIIVPAPIYYPPVVEIYDVYPSVVYVDYVDYYDPYAYDVYYDPYGYDVYYYY